MKLDNRGLAHKGSKVSFGEYGLKSLDHGRLTARQIEAAPVEAGVGEAPAKDDAARPAVKRVRKVAAKPADKKPDGGA
jgi:hypothetical protein